MPRITTGTGRLAELNMNVHVHCPRAQRVCVRGIMDAANLVSEAISILPVSASLKVESNENES